MEAARTRSLKRARACHVRANEEQYLAGTDGPPHPGGLILPVEHYFNIKAVDS